MSTKGFRAYKRHSIWDKRGVDLVKTTRMPYAIVNQGLMGKVACRPEIKRQSLPRVGGGEVAGGEERRRKGKGTGKNQPALG